MIDSLLNYYHYDFVQNALLGGSLIAILGAVIGYFVIIRNLGFAVHAIAHIGFTGATGATLMALEPLQGMLIICPITALVIGGLGNRCHKSEVATGMVLSFSLGLGTLFLALYQGSKNEVTSLLFGNIFGVSFSQVILMSQLCLITLLVLASFSRPLLFASLQPTLAATKKISLPWISISFMILVAIAVSLASQVVGILLVFALIIGPASIATKIVYYFWSGILLSIGVALASVWIGITLACLTDYPPSFWITGILFVGYLLAEAIPLLPPLFKK